ncbi:MAG TPA: F0F1 ATP synthase subunit delta [Opitutaceae bacterium]|nr:F0F1 ATP synthase subunit delta [Opitutaceae bacterium]
MAAHGKKAQQLARQLFKLSVVDGAVSADRVAGVLAYLEKHRPANPVMVLKTYRRLVAADVARGQAVVEHAGPVTDAALAAIAGAMAKKYGRQVSAVAKRNDALLAGLRVRVGDDTYESSVAGQLAALAAAV